MYNSLKNSTLAVLGLLAVLAFTGCPGGGRSSNSNGGANGGGRPRAPDSGPHLAGFQPATGSPGDPVLITGGGMEQVTGVRFGDTQAAMFTASGDTKLYAIVPAGATTGPIRVGFPSGPAQFDQPFTVRHPAPRLVLFSPSLGPAGSDVLLTGTSFTPDLKVWFGAIPAPDVRVRSLTQAVVRVPPGFASGRLRLRTATGEDLSGTAFQVGMAPALAVAGVVITQGSQTPGMNVPLVANRDAFCMVGVVAGGPGHPAPAVRVSLESLGGRVTFSRVIQPPAGAADAPQAVDPANLGALWTVPIEGRYIQRERWLKVELFPVGADPDRSAAIATWPAHPGHGHLLNVLEVPTIEVTLIPVIQGDGVMGNVDEGARRLEDWSDRFKALFPVAEVVVRKGNPIHCNGVIRPGNPEESMATQGEILQLLEARRRADGRGANQIYYGVFKTRSNLDYGGMGQFPELFANQDRCAVGGDWEGTSLQDNRRFSWVFAHEMGHVLSCRHAPSHPPGIPIDGVDPGYPYPKADIGAFGFDVAARELKAPGSFKDVMSYTPPLWISDYNYSKVLTFLNIMYRMHGR
jgi:hypothetical protein